MFEAEILDRFKTDSFLLTMNILRAARTWSSKESQAASQRC